jgi:hypothetical protein
MRATSARHHASRGHDVKSCLLHEAQLVTAAAAGMGQARRPLVSTLSGRPTHRARRSALARACRLHRRQRKAAAASPRARLRKARVTHLDVHVLLRPERRAVRNIEALWRIVPHDLLCLDVVPTRRAPRPERCACDAAPVVGLRGRCAPGQSVLALALLSCRTAAAWRRGCAVRGEPRHAAHLLVRAGSPCA